MCGYAGCDRNCHLDERGRNVRGVGIRRNMGDRMLDCLKRIVYRRIWEMGEKSQKGE